MQGTSIPQLRLTYIGGPTVLIEIGTLRLLTDPTFEAAGYEYKGGPRSSEPSARPDKSTACAFCHLARPFL